MGIIRTKNKDLYLLQGNGEWLSNFADKLYLEKNIKKANAADPNLETTKDNDFQG
jgi:hypothetical protein